MSVLLVNLIIMFKNALPIVDYLFGEDLIHCSLLAVSFYFSGSYVTQNSNINFIGLKGTFDGNQKVIFIYLDQNGTETISERELVSIRIVREESVEIYLVTILQFYSCFQKQRQYLIAQQALPQCETNIKDLFHGIKNQIFPSYFITI